jgi:hypothetical protein
MRCPACLPSQCHASVFDPPRRIVAARRSRQAETRTQIPTANARYARVLDENTSISNSHSCRFHPDHYIYVAFAARLMVPAFVSSFNLLLQSCT